MAYFERRVQRSEKAWIMGFVAVFSGSALIFMFLGSEGKTYNKVSSYKKIETEFQEVAIIDEKTVADKPSQKPDDSEIERLAASDQLRRDVKVEKVWSDGTLSFKVGEDIITVTSDGAVLHLPKEL